MCAPPDLPWIPCLRIAEWWKTLRDKSGWNWKAVKGRGGRSLEWGGNCGEWCELLNHHWKLIRKLAGPGGDGRTDCALPSTIPVMKWKRRGTDFFTLVTPLALKFPHNLCAGCKSCIHEMLTVLFRREEFIQSVAAISDRWAGRWWMCAEVN